MHPGAAAWGAYLLLSDISYGTAMLAWRYGATAKLAALRETGVLFGTALAMSFVKA
jgi:hypothetical protein